MKYVTVMTAAIAAQRDLATAYALSGRTKELGLYVIVQSRATVAFFERMGAPVDMRDLHAAFVRWQRAGIEALLAELQQGGLPSAEASRQFGNANRQFINAFQVFAAQGLPKDT